MNYFSVQSGLVILDFEMKSANNLKKSNGLIYSLHPSTEPLCIAYKINDNKTRIWTPGDAPPKKLFRAIKKGLPVFAQYAFFDKCQWQNVMVAKHGWPEIPSMQWRCSAAAARAMSLPGKLEQVTKALKLSTQKDMDGHRIMMKLSKPRAARKAFPGEIRFWQPDEKRTDFKKMYKYCIKDVDAVYAVLSSIKYLSPTEFAYWQLDQTINERGIYCDAKLIAGAITALERQNRKYNKKLATATGGKITSPKQYVKLRKFLNANGVKCTSVGKEAMPDIEKQPLNKAAKQVVEIIKALNRSSTAKFAKLDECLSPDSRLYDFLVFCGASRTRRWSSQGVQLQNVPRGGIKDKWLLQWVIGMLQQQRTTDLQVVFGKQLTEIVSSCIRPVFMAAPGKILVCADYSAIEARGLSWLAEDYAFLENFKKGIDIYRLLAVEIYGIPYDEIEKDSLERFVGKQGELGLGYQLSATGKDGKSGFKGNMKSRFDIDLPEKLCTWIVKLYRAKHEKVVKLWYGAQRAAVAAIEGRTIATYGRLKFDCSEDKRYMKMVLPSGRSIYYWFPAVSTRYDKYGKIRKNISYWGMHSQSKKWIKLYTYGGKLVENAVQALSRDIMADAMLRVENAGFPVVLTVHDEIVSEIDKPKNPAKALKKFEGLMTQLPEWAAGFPPGVEGWIEERYKK